MAQNKDAKAFYSEVKSLSRIYVKKTELDKLESHVTVKVYIDFLSAYTALFEIAPRLLNAQVTLTTIQSLFRPLGAGETRGALAFRAKALQLKAKCGVMMKVLASLNLLLDAAMADPVSGAASS
jgi:hypothetical protein